MKKTKSGTKDVSSRIPQCPNPRRAQEYEDAMMLHNDESKMSNLPSEPINKEFNKYHPEHMFGED